MSISRLTEANLRRFEDFPFDSRETRIEKVIQILDKLRPQRLLDLGCGNGYIVAGLHPKPDFVVGCDISLVDLRKAQEQRLLCVVVSNLSGVLPFACESFDCIFAGEIIEHLIDTDGFLRECARVLRPEGYLLLTTPNLASFENRLRLLTGFYPIWVDYTLDEGCGHVRAYTPRVLKKQLYKHNFEVLRHVGNFVPFLPQRFLDDLRFRWIRCTGDWFPSLAQDIIMLAKKCVIHRTSG